MVAPNPDYVTDPPKRSRKPDIEEILAQAARSMEEAGLLHRTAVDPNVEHVRQEMAKRAEMGLNKYGKTTFDNPLALVKWIQHLKEELMDAVVYCQAALVRIEGDKNVNEVQAIAADFKSNPPFMQTPSGPRTVWSVIQDAERYAAIRQRCIDNNGMVTITTKGANLFAAFDTIADALHQAQHS